MRIESKEQDEADKAEQSPGMSRGTCGAFAPAERGLALRSGKLAIDVQNATVRFSSSVVAFDALSLQVQEGEFVAIVGPSGCGKTTLLNLAAGLLPARACSGHFEVAGAPPRPGSRNIAYMLARDALCAWRTALENAELGAEIRRVDETERRGRARRLLAQVGLSAFENAYPKELSHGMRQRVALARTFCLESPVLLMDEPFGALDAQTKLQLGDLLLQLWQAELRTVLFITHDLGEAIALADRVVVMSARPGRVVAEIPIKLGRPRTVRGLQKDPAYHELYAELWARMEAGAVE